MQILFANVSNIIEFIEPICYDEPHDLQTYVHSVYVFSFKNYFYFLNINMGKRHYFLHDGNKAFDAFNETKVKNTFFFFAKAG